MRQVAIEIDLPNLESSRTLHRRYKIYLPSNFKYFKSMKAAKRYRVTLSETLQHIMLEMNEITTESYVMWRHFHLSLSYFETKRFNDLWELLYQFHEQSLGAHGLRNQYVYVMTVTKAARAGMAFTEALGKFAGEKKYYILRRRARRMNDHYQRVIRIIEAL